MRQEKKKKKNQDPQKKEDASPSPPPEEEGLGLRRQLHHEFYVQESGEGAVFLPRSLLLDKSKSPCLR